MRFYMTVAVAFTIMSLGCFMDAGEDMDMEEREPAYTIEADFPLSILRLEAYHGTGGLNRRLQVQNVSGDTIQGFRYTVWAYNRFGDPVVQNGFGENFLSYYTQDDIEPMKTKTVRGSEYGFDGARNMVFMFLSYHVDGEEVFCDDLSSSWRPSYGAHNPCSVYFEVDDQARP